MSNNDYFYDNYRLAEFYDDIYTYDDDFELWSKYITTGIRVLEVACGTGRLTKLLLENKTGITVDALDYSQEMLDILKLKMGEWNIDKSNQLNIFNADMRYFSSAEKYDVIIISSNSLNHIETNEDFDLTINNMYDLLKPGGILLLDMLNPGFEYLIRDPDKDYDKEVYIQSKTKRYFCASERSNYDINAQINHVTYKYYYCNSDGEKNADSPEYRMNINVRLYFPQETDYHLSQSKFGSFKSMVGMI